MKETVLQNRNTLKSKQAPQRALQKAFYQLRVFSDQAAQLLTSPYEQDYQAREVRASGAEREGNGFAMEGQGQGCSSCCSGHVLLPPSPGTLNTGNTQLFLWPRF